MVNLSLIIRTHLMNKFSNKNILIGITGGIAAYKTCEIIRRLKKNGAECQVVMTQSAKKFVTPLTFRTLSESPVLCDLFPDNLEHTIPHINAARWADVILLCPATANVIGKIANGIADDLLATILLATTAPVVICPAMNTQMYRHPIVQQNIDTLRKLRYKIVTPGIGELACNEIGEGRLADPDSILEALYLVLHQSDELKGRKILITAGRTEEPWDPVRFLTNHSTGKMGYALAEAAITRGAEVTLVSGPTQLKPPTDVALISIRTAEEMAKAVFKIWQQYDIIIMAAAVADFRPKIIQNQKIKKSGDFLTLDLERTTDILGEIGPKKQKQLMVGFAVETENMIDNARKKLNRKNLDLIVLNNPQTPGTGFGTDTNQVTLLEHENRVEELPLLSKQAASEKIMDKIIKMVNIC